MLKIANPLFNSIVTIVKFKSAFVGLLIFILRALNQHYPLLHMRYVIAYAHSAPCMEVHPTHATDEKAIMSGQRRTRPAVGWICFYSTGINRAMDFTSSVCYWSTKTSSSTTSTGSTRSEPVADTWYMYHGGSCQFYYSLYQLKPVQPLTQPHSCYSVH